MYKCYLHATQSVFVKQVGKSEGMLPQKFFYISAEGVFKPLTLPYIDS